MNNQDGPWCVRWYPAAADGADGEKKRHSEVCFGFRAAGFE